MARKKEEKNIVFHNVSQSLDDIMSDRFGRYSKYIIQERALPDGRDGLKPVQRRILYSMYIDGNDYDKPHRKSAKTVGSVMGTFHPHGDSSIYEAMVRMSQDWKINVPLIDMHGNNGSIDDDPPAAMRYTEARLSKTASLLLDDIDKNAVAMTNNYDDTEEEPTVLPARYPLLLVNGSTGIASGYATNIAPHNITEVIQGTIYRIQHPDCSLDDLMMFIKGPDFPTGGIVQGKENIKEIFASGKGKVVLRSRCEIFENKTSKSIIITEIPYEVIKAALVKKISDISLSKDIEGIVDVRDESDRNGLKIVVELRKDANAETILNYLYKNTDLQINYSYNNIAIIDHRPVLMSLSDALDAFIVHRKEVVLNRSAFLKEKKQARIHIIEGLIKAISILDSVIELIRSSADKKDAKDKLMNAFLFTDQQAEAIVNLRLYRLTNTDIKELKKEFGQLVAEVSELDSILSSTEILDSVLVKELKEVNELIPSKRKTEIQDEVEEIHYDLLSTIPAEDCYLSLSRDGYLKRYSLRSYSSNEGNLPYLKENDLLIGIKNCNTLDTLIIITDKGNYAFLSVYKIDECKFKDLGKHLSAFVRIDDREKVVAAFLVPQFKSQAYLVTVSRKGMIKKTGISRFEVSRAGKVMNCMNLKKDDEVVSCALCYDNDDLLVITKNGYYNYYSADMLADISLKAAGVAAINIRDDEVLSVLSYSHQGEELVCVSQKDGFKRIRMEELRMANRNSRGSLLFKQAKTAPLYLKAAYLLNDQELTLVGEQVRKVSLKEIPLMSLTSSFSGTVGVSSFSYLIRSDLQDIPTVEYVPMQQTEVYEKVFDQTNLFE